MNRRSPKDKKLAKAIGRRVAGIRTQAGATQERAAAAAGLSVDELVLIEMGEGDLHVATLIQLAGAFGVPETVVLAGIKWQPAKQTFEIADPPTHYISGR